MELLQKILINQDLIQNGNETAQLLKDLAFLPLAIIQAATYINVKSITLKEYFALLAGQEVGLIDLLSKDFDDDWRYKDNEHVKNPVATTWLITFKQVREVDMLASKYLEFMACIEPKDIPQSLLPTTKSKIEMTDAIGTLVAYSFVTRQANGTTLDLHRLVHLATRNWLRIEGSLQKCTEMALTWFAKVFPDEDHENRITWRTYLPHAQRILKSTISDQLKSSHPKLISKHKLRFISRIVRKVSRRGHSVTRKGDFPQQREQLLWKVSRCLRVDGRYDEAVIGFEQIVTEEKKSLGEKHPDTLTSMNDLAMTYSDQGRWKEAEELQVQVMETGKRVLGADHPDTLANMNNLALTYSNQGRWKEAEELQVQVMETGNRVFGAGHPDTLADMNNLALTYSD
jgi:tetratricopeptide (TPR) repeat protein